MKPKTKQLTLTAILLALTLIIGITESLLPPIIPILPFIRIGFSNIIIILSIFILNFRTACLISVLKSTLVPLLSGNPMMILYSLPSSLLSIILAYILLWPMKFSLIIISIFSAIIHNLTQLFIAYIIMQTTVVLGYAPLLFIFGILSGTATGIIILTSVKLLSKKLIKTKN